MDPQIDSTEDFDIVGDIHGAGGHLIGLLDKLGYEDVKGVRRHKNRQMIFVGDLIDRGSHHRLVLKPVHAMVEADAAQIVTGNHEFNACTFQGFWARHGRDLR